ncbi:MAG: hypothetical protein GY804_10530 [Alphaproteobacteria bacterium]|nr:hypothetical protein [Alphaproteobacteria bacterium]
MQNYTNERSTKQQNTLPGDDAIKALQEMKDLNERLRMHTREHLYRPPMWKK